MEWGHFPPATIKDLELETLREVRTDLGLDPNVAHPEILDTRKQYLHSTPASVVEAVLFGGHPQEAW